MKLTLIRTNKQNKQFVKLVELGELASQTKGDAYLETIEGLRDFVGYADRFIAYGAMHRLPVVYPSAEVKVDADGNRLLQRFNGLLTLTVAPLRDADEAQAVKQACATLPSTVAVVLGSSGRTAKIVVSASRPDGSLPQTEDDATHFCQQAYPIATAFYQTAIGMANLADTPVVGPAMRQADGGSLLYTGFRMTRDPRPYLHQQAAPLLIAEGMSSSLPHPAAASAATDTDEPAATPTGREGAETRQLISYLGQHYQFRMNTVMGYVEYRSKEKWHYGWRVVDERMQNGLAVEARLAGLNIWDKDVNRYLKSNLIRQYDPIDDYLWQLCGKWDGQDHIGRLARRVPTSNQQWPGWFRTWFLGMVAQWMGKNRRYGNAMAPLLISRQGYNKSTFCKMLLPTELQWGYNDNLVLSEKKAVLQAMSQFLLINLDEFNQISPRLQEGFLKNLIQLASVKVKRPYGRHVEEQPRLASFIATANVTDLLADPSGNRRFIGVELTGPIDVSHPVNHQQLYAQAVALLDRGEPYWLDDEQTRQVMASNQQFQLRSPEELFFHELFTIADSEEDGTYMSTAAIFDHVKRHAGSSLRGAHLSTFGRMLANIDGLLRRRTRFGTEYLVRLTGE